MSNVLPVIASVILCVGCIVGFFVYDVLFSRRREYEQKEYPNRLRPTKNRHIAVMFCAMVLAAISAAIFFAIPPLFITPIFLIAATACIAYCYERIYLEPYLDHVVVGRIFGQPLTVYYREVMEYRYFPRTMKSTGLLRGTTYYNLTLYDAWRRSLCEFSPERFKDALVSANIIFRTSNNRWPLPGIPEDEKILESITPADARTFLKNDYSGNKVINPRMFEPEVPVHPAADNQRPGHN